MQKLTVEELKRLLYDTFCDHLSMKDIENIIMTEESHIANPGDCQVDIDSKGTCLFTSIYFQCWLRVIMQPLYLWERASKKKKAVGCFSVIIVLFSCLCLLLVMSFLCDSGDSVSALNATIRCAQRV